MMFLKKTKVSFIISLVFLTLTLLSFEVYKERTLNGDLNNHILAGEMFGTPIALKGHGIEPLYHGAGQTGWDGQFYYYMSNDLLALKDTPQHIDAPSYRYQRIGLSLYAAIVSKAFGMRWVSPAVYFYSYLTLIFFATLLGAQFFSNQKINPGLTLLWALSVGPQITLFNALPDAAADAFLILALYATYKRRYALSVIPFAFSALSREVYALFPSFIFLLLFVDCLLNSNNKSFMKFITHSFRWHSYYLLTIPGLIAIGWHAYIVKHFGIAPSTQAHGILGAPLAAWMEYFLSGICGNHKLVGHGFSAYAEAISLLLFLSMILTALALSLYTLIKRYRLVTPEARGVCCAATAFTLLYVCFGPTVMMHYSGYMKALAIFFFLIPFLAHTANINNRKKLAIYLLLIISFTFTTIYNMKVRILPYAAPGNDQYTHMSSITETRRIKCFDKYQAKIKIENIAWIHKNFINRLLGEGDLMIITIQLKNTGKYNLVSTKGFGSVLMSYQWRDKYGKVVQDGIRSAIPGVLLPGQTTKLSIIAKPPKSPNETYLKLSPVQEGCAWFYQANPNAFE